MDVSGLSALPVYRARRVVEKRRADRLGAEPSVSAVALPAAEEAEAPPVSTAPVEPASSALPRESLGKRRKAQPKKRGRSGSSMSSASSSAYPETGYIGPELLTAIRARLAAKRESQLIGMPSSPFRMYLGSSPLHQFDLKDSETYHRSEQNPLAKFLKKTRTAYQAYRKTKLEMGDRAHIGGYGNSIQMIGTPFLPTDKPRETSHGDASLFNEILTYKNSVCHYIVEQVGERRVITVGYYHEYPCVMVHIHNTLVAQYTKLDKGSLQGFGDWVNLIVSYFTGLVNALAFLHGLPIELVRRSSFGFLSPSIAPTSDSMRINVGVIPREYANILVQALTLLDNVLYAITRPEAVLPEASGGIEYGSEEHRRYLGKAPKSDKPANQLQLLWAKIEKGGKRTVQNIVRTQYGRDGIAAAVFQYLAAESGRDGVDAFWVGVNWIVRQMRIVGVTLSIPQSEVVSYARRFPTEVVVRSADESFWRLIGDFIRLINTEPYNSKPDLAGVIRHLATCHEQNNLNNLHYGLELLNELLYAAIVESAPGGDYGDGFGSDSDEDDEIDKSRVYAKKLIVHNGMRAIWSAVKVAHGFLGQAGRIYLGPMYYETEPALAMVMKIDKIAKLVRCGEINEANIFVYDLNSCVTTGAASKPIAEIPENIRVLILDNTSTTAELGHRWLRLFVRSQAVVLLFVSSGFKNEQLGMDKNQYGTVRIFAKSAEARQAIYQSIKESEQPILSEISHLLRIQLKQLGAVPVNAMFFKPKFCRSAKDILERRIEALKRLIPGVGDSSEAGVSLRKTLNDLLVAVIGALELKTDDPLARQKLEELETSLGVGKKASPTGTGKPDGKREEGGKKVFNPEDYMPLPSDERGVFHGRYPRSRIGRASAFQHNCLIDSLLQLTTTPGDSYLSKALRRTRCQEIRATLIAEHRTEHMAFLYTHFHAQRILELIGVDPALYRVVTYWTHAGALGPEEVAGAGPTVLPVWNSGGHYQPIWPRVTAERDAPRTISLDRGEPSDSDTSPPSSPSFARSPSPSALRSIWRLPSPTPPDSPVPSRAPSPSLAPSGSPSPPLPPPGARSSYAPPPSHSLSSLAYRESPAPTDGDDGDDGDDESDRASWLARRRAARRPRDRSLGGRSPPRR